MALPGVRTTILDRFYNLSRTDLPGGPLVTVVAKRSTASSSISPDFITYFPTSELDVINQFGENSQLHKAYYELSTGGAPSIALVPLPSDTVFNHTTGVLTSASNSTLDPFDEALAAVESVRSDIVVLWGRGSNTFDWDDVATPVATPGGNEEYGFYGDNSPNSANSWAKKLADKCSEITLNSYPIIGVIGLKPIVGREVLTPSEISAGVTYSNLVSREVFTTGSLISVVAAEVRPLSAPSSWGWSNGACLYAALLARLPAQSAPTGKPVYNVDRVRWSPTRVQAENLSITKGIVVNMPDPTRAPRWVDGTTFSTSTSDYARVTTVRIIFDAVKEIRKVAQNYIGEGMSIQNRNSFETQVSSALRAMTVSGAINSSDFRVQYAPSEYKAYIDLAIVPAFELREIIFTISVNF